MTFKGKWSDKAGMGTLGEIYAARGRAMAQEGHTARLTIIGDKGAYVSPMDRTVVEGRTAHREHMKRHGVMEAGDMKLGEKSRSDTPHGIRQDIQRAVQEVSSR